MKFRNHAPGLFKQQIYLSDGGLETYLVLNKDIALNHFAAFELLQSETGKKTLEEYYSTYLFLAEKFNLGFVIESPTWRANCDWGFKLGYTHDELFALNRQSIKFIRRLARPFSASLPDIIISGNIGPRRDGYNADMHMTAEQARAYHLQQVKAFALADADIAIAGMITYSDEAIGIIHAARAFNLPIVISFALETNGRLPGGESLTEAIDRTDKATNSYAGQYMINCAHPQHVLHAFRDNGTFEKRLCGIRANMTPETYDEKNDPAIPGKDNQILLVNSYARLFHLLPSLKVIDGYCGGGHGLLEQICKSVEKLANTKAKSN